MRSATLGAKSIEIKSAYRSKNEASRNHGLTLWRRMSSRSRSTPQKESAPLDEAYSPEIGRLANPHDNVALLEQALKGLSFEVLTRTADSEDQHRRTHPRDPASATSQHRPLIQFTFGPPLLTMLGCEGGPARFRRLVVALAFVVGLILGSTWGRSSARAEVKVSGDPAAVQLVARQGTVAEALDALASTFRVRHTALVPLNGGVSGTYRGTLAQVLTRVLAGFNYVLTIKGDSIEVLIIDRPGVTLAGAPVPPALPENIDPAAQWMRKPSR
jgi:hypothetical protein